MDTFIFLLGWVITPILCFAIDYFIGRSDRLGK
jgi:hypothetical protein